MEQEIELLKMYIDKWSKEASDNFHKTVERDEIEGQYIWENNSDHVILYRYNSAHKICFDGTVYKLSTQFYKGDWDKHQTFYKLATEQNILVDIPLYKEFIKHRGEIFQFTVSKRPIASLGISFYEDVLEGRVDTSYMLAYIDQVTELNTILKSMGNTAPSVRFTVFHRARVDTDFIWYDIKKWNMSYSDYYKNSISDITNLLNFLDFNEQCDIHKELIIKKAVDSWK